MTLEVETADDPDLDDVQQLIHNLVASNLTVAPPEEHRKIAVFARNDGDLVGGAAGYTHWGWLFVSHLWVADDLRGTGLGSHLMHEIEAAVAQRGATRASRHLRLPGPGLLPASRL